MRNSGIAQLKGEKLKKKRVTSMGAPSMAKQNREGIMRLPEESQTEARTVIEVTFEVGDGTEEERAAQLEARIQAVMRTVREARGAQIPNSMRAYHTASQTATEEGIATEQMRRLSVVPK